jgi:hypothetical protein
LSWIGLEFIVLGCFEPEKRLLMSFENEQEPLAERAGDGAERVLTGIV